MNFNVVPIVKAVAIAARWKKRRRKSKEAKRRQAELDEIKRRDLTQD